MVNEENMKKDKWTSDMLAFSTTSFKDMVKDFTATPQKESLYIGPILLVSDGCTQINVFTFLCYAR